MLVLPHEAAVAAVRRRPRGRSRTTQLQRGRAASQGSGTLGGAPPVAAAGGVVPATGRRGAASSGEPAAAVAVHPPGAGQDQGPSVARARAHPHLRAGHTAALAAADLGQTDQNMLWVVELSIYQIFNSIMFFVKLLSSECSKMSCQGPWRVGEVVSDRWSTPASLG